MSKRVHSYESTEAVVHYDVGLCIHAAECVQGLPTVFDPKRRPWVILEGAEVEELAEVVSRCPTGALQLERKGGGDTEAPVATSSIKVNADGPLYCRGALSVTLASGQPLAQDTRLALCRCGASKNKPFCDNSHAETGFTDAGSIDPERFKAKDPDPDASGLNVLLSPNGPLIVSGPMEITSADGKVCLQTGRAALCRCGASENKPFCDGSHKGVGFVAL